MRQLLLLRHAKSSWDDRDLPDHERPLNRRGLQAAAAMRTAMEGLGLAPDVVLVSSSRRTVQTLEALEPWADTPLVDRLDSLYLAPAPAILKAIQEVGAMARSVLLVGHNPGVVRQPGRPPPGRRLSQRGAGGIHRNRPLASARRREGPSGPVPVPARLAGPWRLITVK